MRLTLLLIMCLLICGVADAADIKAKILDIKIKDRDYIWIKVEYDVEGKKIINEYPMDFKNTVNKTDAEIIAWIDVNIQYQIDRYIEAEFRKNINNQIILDKLQGMLNKQYTKDSTLLIFDSDGDGKSDIEWTIKTDGSYVEKNISSP